MACTNSSDSPPTVIDDDIHRTVDNILKASTTTNDNDVEVEGVQTQPLRTEVYTRLLDALSAAMQRERNGWKDKLHTTLQVGGTGWAGQGGVGWGLLDALSAAMQRERKARS